MLAAAAVMLAVMVAMRVEGVRGDRGDGAGIFLPSSVLRIHRWEAWHLAVETILCRPISSPPLRTPHSMPTTPSGGTTQVLAGAEEDTPDPRTERAGSSDLTSELGSPVPTSPDEHIAARAHTPKSDHFLVSQ